jgi:hypothetical protein
LRRFLFGGLGATPNVRVFAAQLSDLAPNWSRFVMLTQPVDSNSYLDGWRAGATILWTVVRGVWTVVSSLFHTNFLLYHWVMELVGVEA